jgi:cobalt-zinc-cadmium resistance protein CzcA
MLQKIIRWTVENPFISILTTLMVIVLGLQSLNKIPIDAVPDITNIQVMINTKTGSLDPERVELAVTRPIETEMAGIPHLKDIRSISKFGLSQVVLIFEDGVDLYWARQQANERLTQVSKDLPNRLQPELAPMSTGLGEVFMYSVKTKEGSPLSKLSEKDQLLKLREIQDYEIRPQLKKVKGVAEIDSNGGYSREIHVNFFPEKLEKVGLTIKQLVEKLNSLGENAGGGYIQHEAKQIIVRSATPKLTPESIAEFPIALNVLGRHIKVKDVATVQEDYKQRLGAATYQGKETVLGTVLMRVGANGREVSKEVEATLKEIVLPEGVETEVLYSRSYLVDATIKTVIKSLWEGALLVILVLLLLLGSWRAALIVSLTIPLAMLFAAKGMQIFGLSGNLMSLGAIDFGLIVDGSVVLVENIIHHLDQVKEKISKEKKQEIIIHSSQEVIKSVVSGMVLIILVYIPILMLEGVEGKMFRPMASTVLLALVGALLISIFIMPILANAFLTYRIRKANLENDDHHDQETFVFRFLKKSYAPALKLSMQKPMLTIGSTILAGCLSLFLFSKMGADFAPSLDEIDLVIGLSRDTKISLNESIKNQIASEAILKNFPEVKTIFARLGTPESATDPMGVNLADTFIVLEKDKSKWRYENKDALFKAMESELKKLPIEQEISATQPIEMRFNEMLEGSRADVNFKIYGPELPVLMQKLEEAFKILTPIQGIDSITYDPLTALRSSEVLTIQPKVEKISAIGLDLVEFNDLIETAMAGFEAGSVYTAKRRLPLIIHLDESLRDNPESISSLPIPLPAGGTVRLNQIADLKKEMQVTTVARHYGERYAALSINLTGRDVESFVNEAKIKVEKELKVDSGYKVTWGGQFKNLAEAKARLWVIIPLTLAVIFILLWRSLGSLKMATIVYSSVPLAAMGGIYGLFLRDIHFSISAAVGFIALIGIALMNSLVLINFILDLAKESKQEWKQIIEDACLQRLRPVSMTALVAMLGFIPMALNTGVGSEVQRPLATVVVGGLITSTLLTLIFIPAVLSLLKTRSKS